MSVANSPGRRLLSLFTSTISHSHFRPALLSRIHTLSLNTNCLENQCSGGQLLAPSYSVYSSLYRRGAKRGIPKDGKNKGPRTILTDKEMAKVIPVEDLDVQLFGVYSKLKSEYTINLSLRTGLGIETLPVDLEGQIFPLKEIAQISRKSSNVIVVNLSAVPGAIKSVMDAINNSGMNLALQQESNAVILTLPKITREHRENMAKSARTMFIAAKSEIQNIQNTFIKIAKDGTQAGISIDDVHNVSENVKYRADETIKKCEELMKAKTAELLG